MEIKNTPKREALTDASLIPVRNEYGGLVFYKTEYVTREFQDGVTKQVLLKELRDLILGEGKRGLFEKGYLIIEDERVRELFSLEPLEEYNLAYSAMKELLQGGDMIEIENFLQHSSDANLEKLIRVAIETHIRNLEVANLIEAYSRVNIIALIRDKEDEQVEATGVRQRIDGRAPAEASTPIRGRQIIK